MNTPTLPGWSTFEYTREDGTKWYRAEPEHFDRNLPQEVIEVAHRAALVDTSE